MIRCIVAALALFASAQAQAYCIHNETKDRDVKVEQAEHPDPIRNDRRMQATVKPGETKCCDFHQLDCNPGGRNNSVVEMSFWLPGEPEYECSVPQGTASKVKVTGAGTIRFQPNPKKQSAYPYIMRLRTHDKDLTGPSGVSCSELKKKPEATKGKK
jgi:hypothetical protein